MTKIDELVELLATVDDHCANTFCNTCPYQQTSDEYPCTCYAIAQKLIDEGYEKVNKTKKKTTIKEFAERLKKKVHNYYPSIDSYCTSRHVILVKDIDELLKDYENE